MSDGMNEMRKKEKSKEAKREEMTSMSRMRDKENRRVFIRDRLGKLFIEMVDLAVEEVNL